MKARIGRRPGSGLVASLARPGANVTGISIVNSELVGKQLQMRKEISPKLSRVGVLSNPTTSAHQIYLRQAEVAARSLNVRLVVLKARAPNELAGAFSSATKEGADLPFEQATKFDLVVKLKTAKALQLTIPQSVLLRADEVLQ